MRREEYLKLTGLAAIVLLCIVVALRFDWVYSWHWLRTLDRPLVFVVLQAVQVIVAPLPGGVTAFVSGYLFGTWYGVLYTMIGTVIGSLIVFGLARWLGRGFVEHMAEQQRIQRYDDAVARHGPSLLFFAFLLPFFPDDVLCALAGLSRIPLREFLWAVVLGRFPLFLAYSYLGANTGSYREPGFLLVVSAFLLLCVVTYWYKDDIERRLRS